MTSQAIIINSHTQKDIQHLLIFHRVALFCVKDNTQKPLINEPFRENIKRQDCFKNNTSVF